MYVCIKFKNEHFYIIYIIQTYMTFHLFKYMNSAFHIVISNQSNIICC